MTTRYHVGLLAVAGLFGLAAAASGQAPIRLEIIARAGLYAPTSAVGPAAPATGPWYLRLEQVEAAPVLEVEFRSTWPGSRFGLRLVGLVTGRADAAGVFDCYPGLACPAVLLESDAEAMVIAVAADVLYHASPAARRLRPFLLAGAGVKRYRFRWPAAVVIVPAGDHAESALALHAGAGVEVGIGGLSMRVELADWWSGEGPDIGVDPGVPSVRAPRRRAQHDVTLNIGVRLFRF